MDLFFCRANNICLQIICGPQRKCLYPGLHLWMSRAQSHSSLNIHCSAARWPQSDPSVPIRTQQDCSFGGIACLHPSKRIQRLLGMEPSDESREIEISLEVEYWACHSHQPAAGNVCHQVPTVFAHSVITTEHLLSMAGTRFE